MSLRCYKAMEKRLRDYPLSLKLRFKVHVLDAMDEYQYVCLLHNYCSYVKYRLLRKAEVITKELDIQIDSKIELKYLYMLHKSSRSFRGSYLNTGEVGVFWECGKEHIPEDWWRLRGKTYPVWDIKGAAEVQWYDYNVVEDKYKLNTLIESYSPVELELIKTEGPHSVVPWFDECCGDIKTCALCQRKYGGSMYWPNGYYAKTKTEYEVFMHMSWSNNTRVHNITVCNGPCADLVTALAPIKHIRKYEKFPLLAIFLGVINHANYNPHIRRLAEDFVRYARSFLEPRSDGSRCQSDSQVSGQRIEICIN